jgi:putative spermidine/putrescine transport system permease protein
MPAAEIALPWRRRLVPYLQAGPLGLVLALFLVFPILTIIVVSFFDYNSSGQILPRVMLDNYHDVLFSKTTWLTYLSTFRFVVIVWVLTLFIGFCVSYFLIFHIRTNTVRIALFLLTTIPFWTSNIIRMISWIPLLGRNGMVNSLLIHLGLIDKPFEFLLFSPFSVVVAFVHLNTFLMIVPISNSMARIDKSLIEAARDANAKGWQILWNVIIPLSKTGIAIGSIFILTVVMGDFATVRLMSGGQSASVGLMLANQIALLQYPAAAANAVVLLLVMLVLVAAILRIVDIRKEL